MTELAFCETIYMKIAITVICYFRGGYMKSGLNRRGFVKSSVAVASLLPTFNILARKYGNIGPHDDQVNVAVVGYGRAGEVLIDSAIKIPGVRINAVCDIWRYSRKKAAGRLRYFKHPVNDYENYQDMLESEGDKIDCVIVAVPDWMHREIACACLEAGKHVYCEAPMANSIKDAREIVLCQRRTGKLLQIGLQRRSNPRYIHAIENVMKKHNILGKVTNGYAQWNRSVSPFVSIRERYWLPTKTLEKYGYETMEQFLNWRWFSKYGAGPFSDLAPHQLDVFMWAWECTPSSVVAVGGKDYYDRQANDNVMAMYEFKTEAGQIKRLYQQVLSTTSSGGFYEQFLGVDGVVRISEYKEFGNYAWPQVREGGRSRRDWMRFHKNGTFFDEPVLEVGYSKYGYEKIETIKESHLSDSSIKPPYMFHMENFFSAVRHSTRLSCPAEIGYRATVVALNARRSIKERCILNFKPSDFDPTYKL